MSDSNGNGTNNYLKVVAGIAKPSFVFLDDRQPERVEAAVAEARYLATATRGRIVAYRLTAPLRRAEVRDEVGTCRAEEQLRDVVQ